MTALLALLVVGFLLAVALSALSAAQPPLDQPSAPCCILCRRRLVTTAEVHFATQHPEAQLVADEVTVCSRVDVGEREVAS